MAHASLETGDGAPSAKKPEQAKDAASDAVCEPDWTKIPPVRTTARPGQFLIPPTGPGYYSLCEQGRGDFLEKAPRRPWGNFAFTPTPIYDLDFRYLDDPKNTQWDVFDPVKRIHLGDDFLLSFAGQTWVRTMHERDPRFLDRSEDYALFRTRLAGDFWYQDRFRLFAEYLYADRWFGDFDPLPIDLNRHDAQNLFVDARLMKCAEGSAYLRVGRQEMLYGSQRLISPPDWANVRRTFDGIKAFYVGKDWDLDLFWVQPIIPNRNDWDNVDNNQNFFGAWATRKVRPGTARDLYYLFLDNTNPTAVGRGGVRGGQSIHTLGGRAYGDKDNWLYDVELMLQAGTFSNQDKLAGNVSVGLGYEFKQRAWTPQLWLLYDWASGDDHPGQGDVNGTFNQLYPFAHYYFGFLDLIGRQNVQDVSCQLAFWPENWLTCLVQFHNFWLVSAQDALYGVAGAPLRFDPTGNAGNYVGSEIDLLVSAQITAHANLAIGWSRMWVGEFIENTGPNVAPELFYVQLNYRW